MHIDVHSVSHPKKFYDVGLYIALAFSHALRLFLCKWRLLTDCTIGAPINTISVMGFYFISI